MVLVPSVFSVKHHVILGQHILEYPRATAASDINDLSLDIKQYTPLDNLNPKVGDPTIILAGGIGFVKEVYEPFCEEIYIRCKDRGTRIRSVWLVDPTAQGASALLNGNRLGNEPHWFDHSRDVLHMINVFRDDMQRPLVGIGHSFGGAQIVHLSIIHPRLFATLVLIEPAMHVSLDIRTGLKQARGMIRKKEHWPSREAAEAWFRENKFYQRWDTRTLDRMLKYGLQPYDEANHSGIFKDDARRPVKTTSSAHNDLAHMYRANLEGVGKEGMTNVSLEDRQRVPDADPDALNLTPLYRSESHSVFKTLPSLRPSVQYIEGGASDSGAPKLRDARLQTTGIGVGGSGGARLGRVRQYVVSGGQHTMPLDMHMKECSEVAALWIHETMEELKITDEVFKREWDPLGSILKQKVPEETVKVIKEWNGDNFNPVVRKRIEKTRL